MPPATFDAHEPERTRELHGLGPLTDAGPVAWLAFDLAGDLLLTPRVGYRLSRRRFSPLRVLVLLLFLLAVIGLFTGLEALVNRFGAPSR